MWWGTYRYLVVVIGVGVHSGIVCVLNAFFHASTYFLILLGLPWHQLIDYGLARTSAPFRCRSRRCWRRGVARCC
jgi:hypothetical protein